MTSGIVASSFLPSNKISTKPGPVHNPSGSCRFCRIHKHLCHLLPFLPILCFEAFLPVFEHNRGLRPLSRDISSGFSDSLFFRRLYLTAWFDVWERPPVCIHWSRTSSPEFEQFRVGGFPSGLRTTTPPTAPHCR